MIGDALDGSFEVIDVKKGGFGIVYISYHREWGRTFAIKSFQDKYFYGGDKIADKVVEDFYREAETWVKLERHQNIVKAELVKQIDYKPHMLLEYVDGGSLRDRIKSSLLEVFQSVDFAIQFCGGMIYANNKDLGEGKRGIVHRDVKPANIMLTKDGVLKITDFGLVKALGAPTVETPMGTPEYMSPEQFHTMDVDTRSDIYSFGVVLYEMLTGRPPFSPFHIEIEARRIPQKEEIFRLIDLLGLVPTIAERLISSGYRSLEEIAIATPSELSATTGLGEEDAKKIKKRARWRFCEKHQIHEAPTPPRSLNPSIPEELEDIILKCLEKRPENRYQSFDELHEILMEIYQRLFGERPEIKERVEILTAEAWVDKGASLAALGKHVDAIQCYDRALEINPRRVITWRNKGLSFYDMGRFEDAIKCFEKALQINPGNAHVWNHKGVSLAELGRSEEAVQCFEKVLQINPRHAEAWSNKGLSLHETGKFEDALECFKRALQINPRSDELWNNIGVSLAKLDRFEEAIESFDRVLQINPKCSETLLNKGIYFNNVGENEGPLKKLDRALESIKYLDRALEIDPTMAKAWFHKGLQLSLLGKFDEALQCFDEALKLDPDMEIAKEGKEGTLKLKRERSTRFRRGPDSYI